MCARTCSVLCGSCKAPQLALRAVLGEAYLGAKDFALLEQQYENETWFGGDAGSDGAAMANDHRLMWKQTGARSLSCYYRDNFRVVGGVMVPVEGQLYEEIDPSMHVLMLGAERDTTMVKTWFLYSLSRLSLGKAQVIRFREIKAASHHGVLHGEHAESVAYQISHFVRASKGLEWSMMGQLRMLHNFMSDAGEVCASPQRNATLRHTRRHTTPPSHECRSVPRRAETRQGHLSHCYQFAFC